MSGAHLTHNTLADAQKYTTFRVGEIASVILDGSVNNTDNAVALPSPDMMTGLKKEEQVAINDVREALAAEFSAIAASSKDFKYEGSTKGLAPLSDGQLLSFGLIVKNKTEELEKIAQHVSGPLKERLEKTVNALHAMQSEFVTAEKLNLSVSGNFNVDQLDGYDDVTNRATAYQRLGELGREQENSTVKDNIRKIRHNTQRPEKGEPGHYVPIPFDAEEERKNYATVINKDGTLIPNVKVYDISFGDKGKRVGEKDRDAPEVAIVNQQGPGTTPIAAPKMQLHEPFSATKMLAGIGLFETIVRVEEAKAKAKQAEATNNHTAEAAPTVNTGSAHSAPPINPPKAPPAHNTAAGSASHGHGTTNSSRHVTNVFSKPTSGQTTHGGGGNGPTTHTGGASGAASNGKGSSGATPNSSGTSHVSTTPNGHSNATAPKSNTTTSHRSAQPSGRTTAPDVSISIAPIHINEPAAPGKPTVAESPHAGTSKFKVARIAEGHLSRGLSLAGGARAWEDIEEKLKKGEKVNGWDYTGAIANTTYGIGEIAGKSLDDLAGKTMATFAPKAKIPGGPVIQGLLFVPSIISAYKSHDAEKVGSAWGGAVGTLGGALMVEALVAQGMIPVPGLGLVVGLVAGDAIAKVGGIVNTLWSSDDPAKKAEAWKELGHIAHDYVPVVGSEHMINMFKSMGKNPVSILAAPLAVAAAAPAVLVSTAGAVVSGVGYAISHVGKALDALGEGATWVSKKMPDLVDNINKGFDKAAERAIDSSPKWAKPAVKLLVNIETGINKAIVTGAGKVVEVASKYIGVTLTGIGTGLNVAGEWVKGIGHKITKFADDIADATSNAFDKVGAFFGFGHSKDKEPAKPAKPELTVEQQRKQEYDAYQAQMKSYGTALKSGTMEEIQKSKDAYIASLQALKKDGFDASKIDVAIAEANKGFDQARQAQQKKAQDEAKNAVKNKQQLAVHHSDVHTESTAKTKSSIHDAKQVTANLHGTKLHDAETAQLHHTPAKHTEEMATAKI